MSLMFQPAVMCLWGHHFTHRGPCIVMLCIELAFSKGCLDSGEMVVFQLSNTLPSSTGVGG